MKLVQMASPWGGLQNPLSLTGQFGRKTIIEPERKTVANVALRGDVDGSKQWFAMKQVGFGRGEREEENGTGHVA
jgi:hypothetical protein